MYLPGATLEGGRGRQEAKGPPSPLPPRRAKGSVAAVACHLSPASVHGAAGARVCHNAVILSDASPAEDPSHPSLQPSFHPSIHPPITSIPPSVSNSGIPHPRLLLQRPTPTTSWRARGWVHARARTHTQNVTQLTDLKKKKKNLPPHLLDE